ncbi:MAG: magnesium/cobalt transporter CorA [Ignavibacteria bacterium]|nr:magnesium/cobalt transporter CorA [Ignavibacteria bacterium]
MKKHLAGLKIPRIKIHIPRKKHHPPGTSPGTIHLKEKKKTETKVVVTRYTKDNHEELSFNNLLDVFKYKNLDGVIWINIVSFKSIDEFKKFGEHFNLHSLAMEDVFNVGQTPKLEVYDEHNFICFRQLTNEGSLSENEIDIFFLNNLIITVSENGTDPFEPIRKRIQLPSARHRKHKADYLLYTILDLLIDEMFPVLNSIGDEIEKLEDELLEDPVKETIHKIHEIKRKLLVLRRVIWPEREVLSQLYRNDRGFIKASTKIYLRDSYDHSIQLIEIIETYRELASNMIDVYLSSVSNRMNEVMKVLTIIATIFIPLSFIVGFYGMNFDTSVSPWNMPELKWYFGYPFVILIIILVSGGMLIYFKKKKWL